MQTIEKRVTDNADAMITNHRTAINAAKKMAKTTKSDPEKRKLKAIISRLERDIETIKSEGVTEYNRRKAIIKKLDALKAEFNKLYND